MRLTLRDRLPVFSIRIGGRLVAAMLAVGFGGGRVVARRLVGVRVGVLGGSGCLVQCVRCWGFCTSAGSFRFGCGEFEVVSHCEFVSLIIVA